MIKRSGAVDAAGRSEIVLMAKLSLLMMEEDKRHPTQHPAFDLQLSVIPVSSIPSTFPQGTPLASSERLSVYFIGYFLHLSLYSFVSDLFSFFSSIFT